MNPIPFPFCHSSSVKRPSDSLSHGSNVKKFERSTPVKKMSVSFKDVEKSPQWLPEDKDMAKCKEVCG